MNSGQHCLEAHSETRLEPPEILASQNEASDLHPRGSCRLFIVNDIATVRGQENVIQAFATQILALLMGVSV
ncbi:MAG: hypothetical protein VX281_11270, partial [Pseudomonadota bacterium]|nr:hypothetical protein [Pseudomonadota bacterium]